MPFDFKLPDLGEGIREAEILSVKVVEGQTIAEDTPLLEVETDKAVVEIPSPVAGKVVSVYVQAGQTILVGTVMVSIVEANEKLEKPAQEPPRPESLTVAPIRPRLEAKTEEPTPQEVERKAKSSESVIATPATRQLARELKIDLHLVTGSGPAGKISKEDLLSYAEKQKVAKSAVPQSKEATLPQTVEHVHQPLPDFSKYGEVERVPMRSIRRKTAQLMTLSWSKIPHVTHCDEANITKLEKLRLKHEEYVKEKGGKLTLTVLVVKAVAMALQQFPQFNSSFDESSEEIILKRYCNIGLAVATDKGLIVPVISAVDKKNILELSIEISQMVDKTRKGKVELEQLQGGTFTITNIGAISGTSATPIIHYPEAAILAVMRAKERAIVQNGKIESGLIMPLSLAFDHRLTDGAEAAGFVGLIINMLENPSELISKTQLGK